MMENIQITHHSPFIIYLQNQQEVMNYLGTQDLSIDQMHKLTSKTYRISFNNCIKQLILIVKPTEEDVPSINSLEVEYHLTQSLFRMTSIPVPQPICYCEDSSIIGRQFYCREFVVGRQYKPELATNSNSLENQFIFEEATKWLAKLHSINIQSTIFNQNRGLKITSNNFQTLTKKLYNFYKINETKISKNIEDLLYWIILQEPNSIEKLQNNCLIHGNFQLSKIIFHPSEPRVLAILDWKHAYFGNAFLDLANFILPYYIPFTDNHGGNFFHGWQDVEDLINIPSMTGVQQIYFSYKNQKIVPDLNYQIIIAFLKKAIGYQVKYKKTKDLKFQQTSDYISKIGYNFLLQITEGDPFGIKIQALQDGNIWSNWPVSDRCKSYYYRIKDFLKKEVFPLEQEILIKTQLIPESITNKSIPEIEILQKKAKSLGLWNLFISDPMYGKGLTNLEYVFLSELIGLSYIAHEIFNCFAPETGNIKLLIGYGTEYQKQKYLKPLLEGECKSFFAMTEKNVASSDPNNFQMTITENENGYIVNGEKWFVSSAPDERVTFGIVMGKSNLDMKNPMESQSMIIVDIPNPQIKIIKQVSILGFYDLPHSYAEVHFDNVVVPKQNLLGQLGGAFKMAQGRLLGGRLHHCVRQVGLTRRCLDLMMMKAEQRVIFQKQLKESDAFQEKLGKLEIAFQICRLLTLNSGLLMDNVGSKHLHTFMAVSQCKAYIPKTCQQIIDECIEAFGEEGITDDQPLSVSFYFSRAIRLMDGPCELHLRQIARFAFGNHMFNDLNNAQGYGISKL